MEFCFTVVKQGLDISGHKIDLKFHKFIYLGFLKFHVASKIGKETHSEFEIARFGAVISGSPLWGSKHTWGSVAVIGSLWAASLLSSWDLDCGSRAGVDRLVTAESPEPLFASGPCLREVSFRLCRPSWRASRTSELGEVENVQILFP